jgi:hypothetical protein
VALGRLLLGWTNFEARVDRPDVDNNTDADAKIGQLVSTGRIRNSRARSCFSKVEYRRSWEDNRLDHISVSMVQSRLPREVALRLQ